jgi:sugar phosphate isomerase/epimerase
MPTNLACSTACFRHTSIDVALEEIRLAGFQAIDLNLIPGLCDHFDAARQSASERQDFVTLVRNSRLLVPTVTAAPGNFNSPLDNFEFIIQSALAHLKLAAQLACEGLNVACGIPAADRRQFSEQARIQAKGLKLIAQEAMQLGLNLNVWAPHGEGLCRNVADARFLMEQIDEQNVRLLLDVAQVQSIHISLIEAVRGLAGCIGHVRFPDSSAICPDEFFQELDRTGYHGYCALEMDIGEDIIEARKCLRRSLRVLLERAAKPVEVVPAQAASGSSRPGLIDASRSAPSGQNR